MTAMPMPRSSAQPTELGALLAQHDQLQGELRAHLDALTDAVVNGTDFRSKRRGLHRFLTRTMLPFIRAEEAGVYLAGDHVARLRPLVGGLRLEHAALVELAAEVAEATTGPEILAAASALLALFEVHAAIENDILLPSLVDAGAHPKELIRIMTQAQNSPAPTPSGLAAASGEQIVDTRLPDAASCAQLATTAVDGLAVGGSFVLVADHDPRGINYMLRAEKPGVTSWEVLEDGPERWQVRIGKTAAA